MGCPIRKSADQFVCADPRSLSQLITSFFASESLGIPHTPFSTFSSFSGMAHNKPCPRFFFTTYLVMLSHYLLVILSQHVNELFCTPNPLQEPHPSHRTPPPCGSTTQIIPFDYPSSLLKNNSLLSSPCILYPVSCILLKVEDIGFEPMTPCVQGRCSSQLS